MVAHISHVYISHVWFLAVGADAAEQYDSYNGINVKLRYLLRVTVTRQYRLNSSQCDGVCVNVCMFVCTYTCMHIMR